jgi:hypothetical protein
MIEETEPAKRPRGRPATGRKDYDPVRTAGRQPAPLWDDCVAQAEADGESMTAFITEALRRELTRRQRRDARK